ncbi:ferritin-like domain-containing protein [Amycolatopsis ultiminotia]|uniref:Ferritin-like domain-containing protein n=2 Tax=Amycolatopsis ultiminotia TaxID=543629 RepID=A0ABP6VA01_9PSEU
MDWYAEFAGQARRRQLRPEPEWACGAVLDPVVVRSVQRFQVGESGDGENLIASAGRHRAAVELFVEEERTHARLLARLLEAAGARTIDGHWSDALFIRVRRACGPRLELMVLLIAEVVALGYYRALRDGAGDALTTEVAARILADEERHVPFHVDRLRERGIHGFVRAVWRVLTAGAVGIVLFGHGRALRGLGVPRIAFAAETWARFEQVLVDVHRGPSPVPGPRLRARPRGLV